MNSVANVNMCLKIVSVTSLSQLCLSKKKEAVSVRLLQFGFTATDLEEAYMAFEGEKDMDSLAADNAPAAALTDDQLERQLNDDELDARYKHKLGEFRSRIPSMLNAVGRVSQDKKAYTWTLGLSAPILEPFAPDGRVYVTRFSPSTTTPTGSDAGLRLGAGRLSRPAAWHASSTSWPTAARWPGGALSPSRATGISSTASRCARGRITSPRCSTTPRFGQPSRRST
jgi:hypothetical protein